MTSASEYTVIEGLPDAQAYHDLRKLAGMTPPPLEAIPRALENSFASFLAFETSKMVNGKPAQDQKPVAMGRLVGDRSLFLQICDIAVHPDHQRRGLGKSIMQALVDFADAHASQAYISLIADPKAQALYPKYGFQNVAPSLGMFRMKRKRILATDTA